MAYGDAEHLIDYLYQPGTLKPLLKWNVDIRKNDISEELLPDEQRLSDSSLQLRD